MMMELVRSEGEEGQIWSFADCPEMTLHITLHETKVWYDGIDLGPPHGDRFEIVRKGEEEERIKEMNEGSKE